MTLVLLIAVPFATALLFLIAGDRLGRGASGALGTAALAFAFGIAFAIGQAFAAGKTFLLAEIGPWLPLRGADLTLRVGPTAVPLMLTLTGVGTLLALAAMSEGSTRTGVGRFFFALEVLVGGALLVVTARDLVLLLAGWGAVGLASSLLLGHARQRVEGAIAGARAFVFARASDVTLLIGALALLALFRTVDIAEISGRLATITPTPATDSALLGASLFIVTAVLIRTGQLPVHSWLVGEPRGPAAADAAVNAIATLSGAELLIRLAPALHPTALAVAALLGAITAVVAMVGALAKGTSRRAESWITVAQLGAVVVAASVGSPFAANLVAIAAAFARGAAVLAADHTTPQQERLGRITGTFAAFASLAVFVSAALLLGDDRRPFAVALLAAAALASAHLGRVFRLSGREEATSSFATWADAAAWTDRVKGYAHTLAEIVLAAASLMVVALALSGALSLGAPATGLTVGPLIVFAIIPVAIGFGVAVRGVTIQGRAARWMRVDHASEVVYDRGLLASVRLVAAALDRGAEASLLLGGEALGIVLERTSTRVRVLGAASVWRHEAIIVAAAVAIALYWTLR